MFEPVFFTTIRNYSKNQLISDLTAGTIVGIVALPLAIAFAIASGVPAYCPKPRKHSLKKDFILILALKMFAKQLSVHSSGQGNSLKKNNKAG